MVLAAESGLDPATLEYLLSHDNPAHVAASLVDIGMPVLPVHVQNKSPMPGVNAPLITLGAELEQWWSESSAADDQAVACAPADAGLVVMTVDAKRGIGGSSDECWAAEAAWKHMTGSDLEESAALVTITPSGGKHFWFKSDDQVQSTHAKGGIAIKSANGYVVVHGGNNAYTQILRSDAWSTLVIPDHVRPPAPTARESWLPVGPQEQEHLVRRYDRLFLLSQVDASYRRSERKVLQEAVDRKWEGSVSEEEDQSVASCVAAVNSIHALMSDARSGQRRFSTSLKVVKNRWVALWRDKHGDEFGDEWRQVVEVVWSHLLNVALCARELWPINDPDTSASDPDEAWALMMSLLYDEKMAPKAEKLEDLFSQVRPMSIAAQLAPFWDIAPASIYKGMQEAEQKALQEESKGNRDLSKDPVNFADVHYAVFGEPDDYALPRDKVDLRKVTQRIRALTHFRYGQSGGLYRYHSVGPDKGVWSEDRNNAHLHRLMTLMLREHHTTGSLNNVSAAILRESRPIAVEGRPDTFQNKDVICFRNGALEWRVNVLRDPQPDDLITAACPFDWDQQATCTLFDRYLSETVADDAHDLVYQVIGACMYAELPVKSMIFLVGDTDSGKSVLIRVVEAIVGGRNYTSLTPQTIANDRFAASQLYLKRANLAGDISPNAMDDPGMMKMLTGGDQITAQRKYGDHFHFTSTAMQVFSLNEMLRTRDTTEAWFKRVVPIVFDKSIPDSRQDRSLPAKLSDPAVLSGIATKAVRALMQVIERGGLVLPNSSLAKRDEYRQEMVPMSAWSEDRLVPAVPETWYSNEDLYADYSEWCRTKGLQMLALARFTRRLSQYIPDGAEAGVQRRHAGRVLRGVSGINWSDGKPLESTGDSSSDI